MIDLSIRPTRVAATTNPQQPTPPPALSEKEGAALFDGKDMPEIGIEKPPLVEQIAAVSTRSLI